MWPFTRRVQIQASTEGATQDVLLESFLTGRTLNMSVPGTVNAYTSYNSQVKATYRKYNARDSFGNQATRTIVDLRTAFIAGEGVSIQADNEATRDWLQRFIKLNQFDGARFINAVKGSEMAGQSLMLLRPSEWRDGTEYVRATRIPYTVGRPYKPLYADDITKEDVIDILVKQNGKWVSAGISNFVYTRTGGDDASSEGPVTKIGVVLTDVENYDRAIKDMRRINHIFARVTPTYKTSGETETKSLVKRLKDTTYKLGQAFIGTAEFEFKTPETGAHDNLLAEMHSTVKTISGTTGVPVHWFGHVDLMSNRSTAETLYDLIKNQTINERAEWQATLERLLLQAQILFIDSGGRGLTLDPNFQVVLPLLDFGNFLERIRGYSLAKSDGAISMFDYRSGIPGIDPVATQKAIEAEQQNDITMLRTPIPIPTEGEENGQV